MYEISVVMNFSAAHNLRDYKGKCEKLHGHNWQVEAVFASQILDKSGMVVDFQVAKKMLEKVLRYFDHCYVNDTEYFKKVNPTSENIAQFIFDALGRKMKRKKYGLLRVGVWETQGSRATYYE
ncbi:MAG: 6-carboxytetrahydropterin synthase QueD [Candidatus Omnitrophica bacterium]|nr:6-carboxytetrahydropterin synthase QueD [Candidatus Omnitrophota bacterium]MBU4478890.1 6-carboxytetrahydropterin synthase QueD [Candidatus Omnitrophota bacterium]MCG2702956.1 6-carboxytetrahydropterin synthase QueD [Candidatus Omnitrophota bacterium]